MRLSVCWRSRIATSSAETAEQLTFKVFDIKNYIVCLLGCSQW
jgi:hypothetical protein